MKTAISLPDDLCSSADALAKRLGMSRSELIAAALEEFVSKHGASRLTKRLDAVYAANDSALDAPIVKAQAKGVQAGEW